MHFDCQDSLKSYSDIVSTFKCKLIFKNLVKLHGTIPTT